MIVLWKKCPNLLDVTVFAYRCLVTKECVNPESAKAAVKLFAKSNFPCLSLVPSEGESPILIGFHLSPACLPGASIPLGLLLSVPFGFHSHEYLFQKLPGDLWTIFCSLALTFQNPTPFILES